MRARWEGSWIGKGERATVERKARRRGRRARERGTDTRIQIRRVSLAAAANLRLSTADRRESDRTHGVAGHPAWIWVPRHSRLPPCSADLQTPGSVVLRAIPRDRSLGGPREECSAPTGQTPGSDSSSYGPTAAVDCDIERSDSCGCPSSPRLGRHIN